MKQAISRILQRSSDAILVIRLADATVLGVNQAYSVATGHSRHAVVGQPSGDLLGHLGEAGGPTAVAALREGESTVNTQTALWTGQGDLRVGHLTAVVVQAERERHAVCAIREIREASPEDRRLVARRELHRILHGGSPSPDMATDALQALGKCLGWECGVLWSIDTGSANLRCAAVWRAASLDLERFEEATRNATIDPGHGLAGQVWLSGKPVWVADASIDPDFRQRSGGTGAALRGRLAFPAWGPDGVVGVVEFSSVEPRTPDEALQGSTREFGRLYGWLLQALRADDADLHDEPWKGLAAVQEPASITVSDALRNLVQAVDAMRQALQGQPLPAAPIQPPTSLQRLVAGIGEFTRFLEHAIGPDADGAILLEPTASSAAAPSASSRLPNGLTLKAVSQRTAVPAATLRTWERRYGFLQPARSPSGYRIYGEEEVARIKRVKYLLDQGVRIGEAMAALTDAADHPESSGAGDQVVDQAEPGHGAKDVEGSGQADISRAAGGHGPRMDEAPPRSTLA